MVYRSANIWPISETKFYHESGSYVDHRWFFCHEYDKCWLGKGKLACPVCLGSVQGFLLKHSGKCSFHGTNRIFLEPNDPLRKKSCLFDHSERRLWRGRLSEEEVKTWIHSIDFPPPGKTNKKIRSAGYGVEHHWTHAHCSISSLISLYIVCDIPLISCIPKKMCLRTYFLPLWMVRSPKITTRQARIANTLVCCLICGLMKMV